MATFCTSGRITLDVVEDEMTVCAITGRRAVPPRLRNCWAQGRKHRSLRPYATGTRYRYLPPGKVAFCCRTTAFDVSRQGKASVNDADRLRKYLARFGLTWEALQDQHSSS